jgi:hypothetical protein
MDARNHRNAIGRGRRFERGEQRRRLQIGAQTPSEALVGKQLRLNRVGQ